MDDATDVESSPTSVPTVLGPDPQSPAEPEEPRFQAPTVELNVPHDSGSHEASAAPEAGPSHQASPVTPPSPATRAPKASQAPVFPWPFVATQVPMTQHAPPVIPNPLAGHPPAFLPIPTNPVVQPLQAPAVYPITHPELVPVTSPGQPIAQFTPRWQPQQSSLQPPPLPVSLSHTAQTGYPTGPQAFSPTLRAAAPTGPPVSFGPGCAAAALPTAGRRVFGPSTASTTPAIVKVQAQSLPSKAPPSTDTLPATAPGPSQPWASKDQTNPAGRRRPKKQEFQGSHPTHHGASASAAPGGSLAATPASTHTRKTKDTGWKHKLEWLLAYHEARQWAKLNQLCQAFWADRQDQLQSDQPPPATSGPADSPTWFSKATWFMQAVHDGDWNRCQRQSEWYLGEPSLQQWVQYQTDLIVAGENPPSLPDRFRDLQ
ncbi:unnamed protein product [Symbiodinium natans]|uniref:Uncharacterized protein n=1 Tax=Symbiodinium natans TaxID=878477 RepID=A0A812U8Q0_9DINO|nr:unnamed protein product [Symbiodinium natans]